ncbi:inorganic pyrophosphatase [Chloroflexota bacterium]
MPNFWTRLDNLIASSEVIIDRPKGSTHPKYSEIVYPLDYGYLKNTSGGDGDGIDVWQGSMPDKKLVAIVCTVDMRKRDAEIKLLAGCTNDEMDTVHRFHNDYCNMSGIIIKRDELSCDIP